MAHIIRIVPIKVQSKRCRGMAEILLHGLDVVPRAYRIDSIRVAQVMDPCIRKTDLIDDALKAVIDSAVGNIAPQFRCRRESNSTRYKNYP